MKASRIAGALASVGALAVFAAAPADARVKDVWVAAVPNSWNVAPSGHDPISGEEVDPSEAVFGTVVYRRFTKRWKKPLRNAPVANVDIDTCWTVPLRVVRHLAGDVYRWLRRRPSEARSDSPLGPALRSSEPPSRASGWS